MLHNGLLVMHTLCNKPKTRTNTNRSCGASMHSGEIGQVFYYRIQST